MIMKGGKKEKKEFRQKAVWEEPKKGYENYLKCTMDENKGNLDKGFDSIKRVSDSYAQCHRPCGSNRMGCKQSVLPQVIHLKKY